MKKFTLNLGQKKEEIIDQIQPLETAETDSTHQSELVSEQPPIQTTDDKTAVQEEVVETLEIQEVEVEEVEAEEEYNFSRETDQVTGWIEQYGFSPSTFQTKIPDIINTLINNAIAEVDSFVKLEDPVNCEKIISQLSTMYALYFDRGFDVLEGFMSSTLDPRKTISKDNDYSSECKVEEDNLDEELEKLRREILTTQYYNQTLVRELQVLKDRSASLVALSPFVETLKTQIPLLDNQLPGRIHLLAQELASVCQMKLETESRVKDVSFVDLVSKADLKTTRFMDQVSDYIESKRNNQLAGSKLSSHVSDYNDAMKIASVADVQAMVEMIAKAE